MQHSGRAVSQRATRYSSRDAHDYIRPITSSSIWNTFSVSTPVWFPEHTNGNEITEPQKNIQIFSLTQTILNHKIHKMTERQCHCHCIQHDSSQLGDNGRSKSRISRLTNIETRLNLPTKWRACFCFHYIGVKWLQLCVWFAE